MAFLSWAVVEQTVPVFAQDQSSADANMQILRDKLKADKKLVVAANMELTDAEAKSFWPVYEAYQKDLQSLNERLKKAILSYADAYNNKTSDRRRGRSSSPMRRSPSMSRRLKYARPAPPKSPLSCRVRRPHAICRSRTRSARSCATNSQEGSHSWSSTGAVILQTGPQTQCRQPGMEPGCGAD